jgi:hypothetical protein
MPLTHPASLVADSKTGAEQSDADALQKKGRPIRDSLYNLLNQKN